jgi:hypothetical protein
MRVRLRQVPTNLDWWYVETRTWYWPFWRNVDSVKGFAAAKLVAENVKDPVIVEM